MFKHINKIVLAAALVALVLTSCTEEADVLDNTPIKNKKTLTQPTIDRPYPEYEESDMSSSEAIELVSRFDKAMKGDTTISSIDITNAVSALETYFNYGVVAKQEIVDTTTYYTGSVFQFEVNVDAQGNINGAELVDAYTIFLNNFIQQMNGKYLQLSDLFVKAEGNGKVMFALEIPSFTEYDKIIFTPHQSRILKPETGPFNIPVNYTIDLTAQYNVSNGQDSECPRLSEACVTTVDGFSFHERTYPQDPWNASNFFLSYEAQNPFILSSLDIESILPLAINDAIKTYQVWDYKVIDFLFSTTFVNKPAQNSLLTNWAHKKVRIAKIDTDVMAYYWGLLDLVIFSGI